MHTHATKKDYSRCFAPHFEEVCDKAVERAKEEGEHSRPRRRALARLQGFLEFLEALARRGQPR